MPSIRPTTTVLLAVIGALSLLLNITLLWLLTMRSDSPPIASDREQRGDRPIIASEASRKVGGSARVETEGLPPGCMMLLRGHRGSISTMTFSTDKSRLVIMTEPYHSESKFIKSYEDEQNRITLWNLNSRAIEWESQIPETKQSDTLALLPLALSTTGDRFVHAVMERESATPGYSIHIHDLPTGHEMRLRDDRAVKGRKTCISLAFSPDGKTIAAGGTDSVALFDLASGDVRTLQAEKCVYYGNLRYSADGTCLLTMTVGQPVLFDIKTGRDLGVWGRNIYNLGGRPCSASLSPGGGQIAASWLGNEVRVWDVKTGQEILATKDGYGRGCWLEFAQDGNFLLTASLEKPSLTLNIRRRGTTDGKLIDQAYANWPDGWSGYLTEPTIFSADGRMLARAGGKYETREVRDPHPGFLTDNEGIVVIYDTSELLGRAANPTEVGR
jgi:WD40 repeat protein